MSGLCIFRVNSEIHSPSILGASNLQRGLVHSCPVLIIVRISLLMSDAFLQACQTASCLQRMPLEQHAGRVTHPETDIADLSLKLLEGCKKLRKASTRQMRIFSWCFRCSRCCHPEGRTKSGVGTHTCCGKSGLHTPPQPTKLLQQIGAGSWWCTLQSKTCVFEGCKCRFAMCSIVSAWCLVQKVNGPT